VTRCLTFSILLLVAANSAAAQEKKAPEQPKKPPSEAWYYKLARILGVDRAPSGLKGPMSAHPGELWTTPVERMAPRRLAEGSDFSSPVFQPGAKYVFALRQSQLVRVPVEGGAPVNIRELPRAIKLVGFDAKNPDWVLVLFESGQGPNSKAVDVVLLSVISGKQQVIVKSQPADGEAAETLLGWQRQYGNIMVRPQGGQIIIRGIESTDTPLTDSDDGSCSEPAYSPELKQVVFVRAPK